MAKSKLGIGLGISDRVYVGKINHEKGMWVGNKEDITNQFIDVMSSFIPSDKRRYIDSIKDGEIIKTNIFYNIVKDKESIEKAIANLTKELECFTTTKVVSDKMYNILSMFYSQIVNLRTNENNVDTDYQKTVDILNDVFKNLNEELNIQVVKQPVIDNGDSILEMFTYRFKDSNEIVNFLNGLKSNYELINIYDLYLKGGEIYLRMYTEV